LATFLSANRKGGKITQELKINFCPLSYVPRPIHLPPALADFEMLKVLGTGGFSQVLMGKQALLVFEIYL